MANMPAPARFGIVRLHWRIFFSGILFKFASFHGIMNVLYQSVSRVFVSVSNFFAWLSTHSFHLLWKHSIHCRYMAVN